MSPPEVLPAAAGATPLDLARAGSAEPCTTRLRKLDPMRAHGAWVLLCASVGAGALVATQDANQRALLVGTGVVGGYLLTSAIFVGIRRRLRQAALGAGLTLLAPIGALWLDPSRAFLVPAAIAAMLSIVALGAVRWRGFLSRSAIFTGTGALVLAAPVAAVGGGATPMQAAVLYGLLWPCFTWRTLRVASSLKNGGRWNGKELRSRGLREAGWAAAWALLVSATARFVA